MGVRRVVAVTHEVLGADLPVRLDSPSLGAAELHAQVALGGVEVEVEREVAEPALEVGGVGIEAGEDHAVAHGNRRRSEKRLTFQDEAGLPAVCVEVERKAGEGAIVTVRPGVGTGNERSRRFPARRDTPACHGGRTC